MAASMRPAPNTLLMLCSSTAILITFTGLVFLVGTHLLRIFAHSERFIGETDAVSIALIFGGVAVALKTIEMHLKTDPDSSAE